MLNLVRRLFPMPGDIVKRHGRHRGRPALVARRPVEHMGATVGWSPTAELARIRDVEPDEMLAEAAEREALDLVRHRTEVERAAEEETLAEFAAAWARIDGVEQLLAKVDEACWNALVSLHLDDQEADRLLARYQLGAEPTGEWPTVQLQAVR